MSALKTAYPNPDPYYECFFPAWFCPYAYILQNIRVCGGAKKPHSPVNVVIAQVQGVRAAGLMQGQSQNHWYHDRILCYVIFQKSHTHRNFVY